METEKYTAWKFIRDRWTCLRNWLHYIRYMVRKQRLLATVLLVIGLSSLLVDLAGLAHITGAIDAVAFVQRVSEKADMPALAALARPAALAVAFATAAFTIMAAAIGFRRELEDYRFGAKATIKKHVEIIFHHVENDKKGSKFGLATLGKSPSQKKQSFETRFGGSDSIFASDVVDALLMKRDWHIKVVSSRPARTGQLIEMHRRHALGYLSAQLTAANRTFVEKDNERLRKRVSLLINEQKLCLGSELREDQPFVDCHRGGYFDSVCTNEACMAELTLNHQEIKDSLPYDALLGRVMYPLELDNEYVLQDLNRAAVNNHIGVSTLALTRDNFIVVWQQTKLNVMDPDKIISTGSGSCDYADLVPHSLRRTLERGMERELVEECLKQTKRNLPSNAGPVISRTKVIGFFRWLQRGGKPEFVGISRLSVTKDQLIPGGTEVGTIKARIAGSNVTHELLNYFLLENIAGIPDFIKQFEDRFRYYPTDERQKNGNERRLTSKEPWPDIIPIPISLPLQRILQILEHLCTADPARLQRILFED